ncbi:MAG: GNAT family N-acetyltransferase [Candidatus Hodarchaeales archaeon]
MLNNTIDFREARSYELFRFFKYAINAEQPNLKFKKVIFIFLFLLMFINLLLLGIPRKIILKILKIIFLEKDGEKIGGFLLVDKLKDRGYFHFGGFFIRPKYQGRGFGTIAMDKLIAEYGHHNLTLGVDENNTIALHLYKKHGFYITETLQKFIFDLPLVKQIVSNKYSFHSPSIDELPDISKKIQNISSNEEFSKELETFGRKKKLKNTIIIIAMENDIFIGFCYAKWKKGKTKAIFNGSIKNEYTAIFPLMMQHVSILLQKQGIIQLEWKRNKQTEFLHDSLNQILNQPVSSKLNMERKGIIK